MQWHLAHVWEMNYFELEVIVRKEVTEQSSQSHVIASSPNGVNDDSVLSPRAV